MADNTGNHLMTMADNTGNLLSVLRIELGLDLVIDFLNNTLHNYERPVKRGFFCSDTSIRYPYSPDDTVSIPLLLCIVTFPFFIMTLHWTISYWMFTRRTGSFTSFHRPHPMGLVGGALFTALLAACIKLGTGRLAPNFYEGCQPDVKTCWNGEYSMTYFGCYYRDVRCWDGNLNYHTEFTCSHPERLREVSRSFPCMYTSLSFFTWCYFLIYCVYTTSATSLIRTVLVVISLMLPTIIAFTRLHDNRSHPGDVIAGCLLGMFIAAVSAIVRTTPSEIPSNKDVRSDCHLGEGIMNEHNEDSALKPTVRVCSSALLSNIEGFVCELEKRYRGLVDSVLHEKLPFNDLDAFTPKGWDKSDVIILCHSIDNRRLSLTDVTDALYDKFIPKVSKLCGKNSLIVIAHDFKWTRDPTKARMDTEETLRAKQPTVYEHAGHVILAERLGRVGEKRYDGLCDQDWGVIDDVISESSKRRP